VSIARLAEKDDETANGTSLEPPVDDGGAPPAGPEE
jgi:hypothetical protein